MGAYWFGPVRPSVRLSITLWQLRNSTGKNDFPYHFKKIIGRYKKIGYNINVMRQTACLVVLTPLLTSLIARR